MEPMIYKPGAYKTPGVYKGAGGIYNGRGVYNMGGGSPVPPLPPGYKQFGYIKYLGHGANNTNWEPLLPINTTNENTEFIYTYKVEKEPDYQRDLIKSYNSEFNFLVVIRRQGPSNSQYSTFANGSYTWPNTLLPLSYSTEKSSIKIINGQIKDAITDSILIDMPSAYAVSNYNGYWQLFISGAADPLTFYRFTINRGGITLYDYVPCLEEEHNYPGVYDIINNLFVKPNDPASYSYYELGND